MTAPRAKWKFTTPGCWIVLTLSYCCVPQLIHILSLLCCSIRILFCELDSLYYIHSWVNRVSWCELNNLTVWYIYTVRYSTSIYTGTGMQSSLYLQFCSIAQICLVLVYMSSAWMIFMVSNHSDYLFMSYLFFEIKETIEYSFLSFHFINVSAKHMEGTQITNMWLDF
jgi:hypothetical protein